MTMTISRAAMDALRDFATLLAYGAFPQWQRTLEAILDRCTVVEPGTPVAWSLAGPDGDNSLGGAWFGMDHFETAKKFFALREGHRFVFAYSAPTAASAEAQPSGYHYVYGDPLSGNDVIVTGSSGGEWNGQKPRRAVPYYYAPQSTPALREVTDGPMSDARALEIAQGAAVHMGNDYIDLLRALDYIRARLSTAQGVEARLWDSQWVNIVNHADCWKDYSKERAVNNAVEMTEKAMAKNIRDGFPPAKSAPEAP